MPERKSLQKKNYFVFILFSSKIRAAEEVGVALKTHVDVSRTPARPFPQLQGKERVRFKQPCQYSHQMI